jgi:hypothetical protein
MNIFKTLVALEGDGYVYTLDTIEYKGKMWLVPEWIEPIAKQWTSPLRIICLDVLPHQKSSSPDHDFVLNNPIPKCILAGQVPLEKVKQYVVIERPDVRLIHPDKVN